VLCCRISGLWQEANWQGPPCPPAGLALGCCVQVLLMLVLAMGVIPRCKHRYGTWREPLTTLALLGLGIVIRLLGEQSPACEEVARPVHVPLCAAMLTRRRPHLPSRPQAVTYGRRVDHFHLHRGSGLLLALRVLAVFDPAAPTAIFLLYFRFPTWWNLTAVLAAVLLPVRGPSAWCGCGSMAGFATPARLFCPACFGLQLPGCMCRSSNRSLSCLAACPACPLPPAPSLPVQLCFGRSLCHRLVLAPNSHDAIARAYKGIGTLL